MTKHIQNARRVGLLLDDQDNANAELIARHYRTSKSGAVRIALAEAAAKIKPKGGDAMRITVQFSDDTIFGNADVSAIDLAASRAAFAEHVTNHLYDAYPGANIRVCHGQSDVVQADDAETQADVKRIIDRVWNDADWAVKQ